MLTEKCTCGSLLVEPERLKGDALCGPCREMLLAALELILADERARCGAVVCEIAAEHKAPLVGDYIAARLLTRAATAPTPHELDDLDESPSAATVVQVLRLTMEVRVQTMRGDGLAATLAAVVVERDRLKAALERVVELKARPGESDAEAYERLAERFRIETGITHPGKDEADAIGSTHSTEERMAALRAWIAKRWDAARAALEGRS